MGGLDLYFDHGPGQPQSRDDLYRKFVDLRDQIDSGAQSVAWSSGGSLSYISRDQAYMQMRRMLRKLGELDGKNYGAGLGTIEAIRLVAKSPYGFKGYGPR
jgi:hypothetical protein